MLFTKQFFELCAYYSITLKLKRLYIYDLYIDFFLSNSKLPVFIESDVENGCYIDAVIGILYFLVLVLF